MRMHAFFASLAALAICSGCAAPEFKTYYLSARDWRGADLSAHGQIRVADVVAGAAPRTNTIVEIGGLLEEPLKLERRLPLQEARARSLVAALERHGVPEANIGVQLKPATGADQEPPPPLLKVPMVVLVHF